jgi:hypothetical protein
MQRGADIQFLSAFPAESEMLLYAARRTHDTGGAASLATPVLDWCCDDRAFARVPTHSPPLTFLKPTKKNVDVVKITPHMWGGGGATVTFTVVEVEPQVA